MPQKKKKGEAPKKKKGGILGDGMAENARQKLKGRKSQLEDALNKAMGNSGTITKRK